MIKLFQPHAALKPYVRYYWALNIQMRTESMLNLQVMTDRFPRIVIQCLQGKNALHSDHYSIVYPASLKGIASKPALVRMEPNYSHVAVSLYPHGIKALFGIDGHETIDGVFDLQHFFSADTIEQIINVQPTHARILLIEACLLRRLSLMKPIDRHVTHFLNLYPRTNYGRQLREYGISERQFERRFLQSVGFTPSFYKRVVRFEMALHRMQHRQYTSLAHLAYDLGYSDQAHFNRECKQFSGSTPLSLLKKDALVKESGSILA